MRGHPFLKKSVCDLVFVHMDRGEEQPEADRDIRRTGII